MTTSSPDTPTHRMAYFISPHGFGHAARAAGVMAAIHEIDPAIRFEIFTRIPRWFFEDSLTGAFGYHEVVTDIGLVQKTSLTADLPATLRRLHDFLPFKGSRITRLARLLHTLQCALIICDISPMGIAVAKQAGIPCALVENFTWDWIYQEYSADDSRMRSYITYLQDVFGAADYHLQTEPVCSYQAADLITPPVSRKVTTPAAQIRDRLAIPHEAKTTLLTMGGTPTQYPFMPQLARQRESFFVIPGAVSSMQQRGNVVLLPHRSAFFHPDLVNACDAVVGKAGYSTIAEVYYAGLPFGYITRQAFRESPILAAYIDQHMQGMAITQQQFHTGNWLSRLPELLALPRISRNAPNGADQVARFLYRIVR